MRYRADIDGLRALAVLPVIAFHAGVPGVSGGFAGVDVFFVISGYLITAILMRDIAEGRFSVAGFYERRARRILPALVTVVAATAPFAALWMFPEDLPGYFRSVVAVAVFGSNLLFLSETGYFDGAAEEKPLLHTWSLAVEEQFYILFPLLLLAVARGGVRRMTGVFLALAIASFALSVWGGRWAPSSSFYLLPARAWELMAGALCALAETGRGRRENGAGAALGLGLIAVSMVVFDGGMPWPSWRAAVPVLGTALVILCAGPGTLAGRALSLRPLAALGLLSYSAYLWHHPLFALARIRSVDPPGPWLMAALALLSLGLAALTWAFVERPFRRQDGPVRGRTAALRLSAVALAGLTVLGAAGLGRQGPGGVPEREITLGACNVDRGDCYSLAGAERRVVLWGDSYADAFLPSLGRAANAAGLSLEARVMSSCPALPGTVENEAARLGAAYVRDCRAHNRAAHAAVLSDPPEMVILATSWQQNLFHRRPDGAPKLLDADDPELPPETFVPRRLGKAARAYLDAGSRVLVVLPHPLVPGFERARKAHRHSAAEDVLADRAAAEAATGLLLGALPEGVETLDLGRLMCPGDPCSILDDAGHFLLYDGSHVSTTLAGRLAEALVARVGAGI